MTSIHPKASKAHLSKSHDLVDSTSLLLISLYFDRTADATFVNFPLVETSFLLKKHFVLKLNDVCELQVFCLSASDWFFL